MQLPASNPASGKIVSALWMLLIVAAAAGLRFADLAQLPFHADEAATGAQTLAYRLESSAYEFDPKHFHGPMLTALAEPWCRLQNETSWRALNEVTLRQLVAGCGVLTVLGALGLGMGWSRAAIAMGLAATSPLLVYYSRVFIHEPVFLLFAVLALGGLLWLSRGRHPWIAACAMGLGLGGMAATRETVVVSLFAWGLAAPLFAWRQHSSHGIGHVASDVAGRVWKPLLLAASLTLGVIFLFYSAGGRNPSGFIGFFTTYFEYETGAGHEKPFAHYFELLVWPKLLAGRWWSEAGIFFLALCVYLDRRGNASFAPGRFFFEAGLLHLLAFSFISYKTPWLACLGWLHWCFAGGYGAVALTRRFPTRWRALPILGVALITIWQGVQAVRATGRLASDGRNPYAYVPTSKDAVRLPAFLDDIREALPESREQALAVIGDQYWPLPWYLREAGPVGYWSRLPEDGMRLPLLLVLPSALEETSAALGETHTFIPRGLRDEVPVMVAVRNDLWKAYQAR